MGSNILPITMPKWGLAMKEGSIVKWNKEVGEEVKKGEALVEIETEKVVNEFESPENGTMIKKCISPSQSSGKSVIPPKNVLQFIQS